MVIWYQYICLSISHSLLFLRGLSYGYLYLKFFPNEVRAKGQALGSFTHWFMASVIAFTFPFITETLGGGNTFMLFSVMMVLQLLFVWKIMPETKGKSLEDLNIKEVETEKIII